MRSLSVCVLAFALISGSAAAQQQIYRWVDSHGGVHYSSQPPQGQPYQSRTVYNSADPAAAATTAKTADNSQCATARNNLKTLQDKSRPVQMNNGEGKAPTTLSDADRDLQTQAAKSFMAANHCNPG